MIINKGECANFQGISIAPDGEVTNWENILTPVVDNSGVVTSILCVSRNITQQVMAESKLKVISEMDEFTESPVFQKTSGTDFIEIKKEQSRVTVYRR